MLEPSKPRLRWRTRAAQRQDPGPGHVLARPQLRAFVAALVLASSAQVAGLAAVILIADPHDEFPGDLVPPLAPNLIDEKLRAYHQGSPPAPTVVVGSSRVQTLTSRHMADAGFGPAYNFAAIARGPSETRALVDYLAHQPDPPASFVIGLDLNAFQGEEPFRWGFRRAPELAPHAGGSLGVVDYAVRLVESLTLPTLRASLSVFQYQLEGYPQAKFALADDGSLQFPDRPSGPMDPFLGNPRSWDLADGVVRYGDVQPPGRDDFAQLAATVAQAHSAAAEAVLFTTPVHPRLLTALVDSPFPSAHRALVEGLRSLCGPGVRVVDLTSIETFGGDPAGFYDWIHYDASNAARVAAALGDPRLDACAQGGRTVSLP